jgi:hypothetical protein
MRRWYPKQIRENAATFSPSLIASLPHPGLAARAFSPFNGRMNYGETVLGVECALPRHFSPAEPRRRAPGAWKGETGQGLKRINQGARRLRHLFGLPEDRWCNATCSGKSR